MTIQWRMLVWDSTGASKDTIGMDDAIDELTSFPVDGAGNCLRASFTGVGADLDLRPRDIIQLQVDPDGSGWQSIWKGFIVQAPASRSKEIRQYAARGLKQRLYERHLETWFTPTADPPQDVRDAVLGIFDPPITGETQNWVWPAGITYDTANVPSLNFEVGVRFPNTETAGDSLDSLAEMAGRFIVPSGSTYTYDGATYDPGDVVPRARWGVDAEGAFFFKRAQASAVSVGEGDAGVHVSWRDSNAEEACDHVMIVFASDTADGWVPKPRHQEGEPQVLWKKYGQVDSNGDPTGDLDAEKRIVLEAPIDLMSVQHTENGFTPSSSSWAGLLNPFDGDDSTHATVQTGETGGVYAEGDGRYAIARLRVRAAEDGRTISVTAHSRNSVDYYGKYILELEDSGETYDFYLPVLTRDRLNDNGGLRVTAFTFEEDDRVYALELYYPDDEACERLADAYAQPVTENPAEVRLSGSLGSVSQTMAVTPTGESEIEVDVERVEYHLSTDGGLVTTYHLQQIVNTDLLSDKVVLDRIARARGRAEASGLMKVRGASKGRS